MTLDDLIGKIAANGGSISASVHKMAHGNQDGAGDYRIVTIKIGSESIVFNETPSGWQPATNAAGS